MAYPQGAIVFATDPFGGNPGGRPYVVLSNSDHPFADEECVAAVITTTERAAAIKLDEKAFTRGSLPKRSFVSPWSVVTLKNQTVTKHVATVTKTVVDTAVSELNHYLAIN